MAIGTTADASAPVQGEGSGRYILPMVLMVSL